MQRRTNAEMHLCIDSYLNPSMPSCIGLRVTLSTPAITVFRNRICDQIPFWLLWISFMTGLRTEILLSLAMKRRRKLSHNRIINSRDYHTDNGRCFRQMGLVSENKDTEHEKTFSQPCKAAMSSN